MAFHCGLFQLSFSSGVPVYPASIRWVTQWYPSVHWVNQWHSSGIPVYTEPANLHCLRVRVSLDLCSTEDKCACKRHLVTSDYISGNLSFHEYIMKSLSPDIMELWLNNYRNVDLFPPAIGTDGHSCYLRLPVCLLTRPFRNILPFQIKCMYAYLYGSWLFEIKLFGQICKFPTNLKFFVATVELAWQIMLPPLERSRPLLKLWDLSMFPFFWVF